MQSVMFLASFVQKVLKKNFWRAGLVKEGLIVNHYKAIIPRLFAFFFERKVEKVSFARCYVFRTSGWILKL